MGATQTDRILTLDAVRGVAVMGILLMNIVAFGLIEPAYMNPRAQGGASGADLAVYLVNFVLFDGKMRGLFSFLFGASTLLVIDRATAKGENPARVHYARMIWLLAFGLAHLWLLWWGDILNHYALVGMIAFFFRRMPVRRMIAIGGLLILFQTLVLATLPTAIWTMSHGLGDMSATARAATLAGFDRDFGVPPAAWIAERMALYRGGYATLTAARFHEQAWAPINTLIFVGPETLAYMLFGMAGLKSGMLSGAWPRARYRTWLTIGFGIGIPAYLAIAAFMVAFDFSTFAVVAGVLVAATPFRPAMIVGWACLIILTIRPGGALTARIAAAGRMAFTNYLVTSLICTTIFYGYGLGWFGALSRAELYLVVAAVWAGMLLWSKPWLERFRYGPFEWGWRSLARFAFQPMRGGALAGG
ncbi:DUF418 domain-containing protein [Sphingomonas sp.]|uniref:DUF418 domain-containing protein n=1 Tax=Sphingomonas sp. TaxID=28214 RepID=UPI002B571279|nr:DUF418 domain-containing protein [Sphingomonas sp.]HWK36556.1 DUF418 domain-containing protein [Sphingomonas sp.]